jgi:2'-5' RNA ligase
MARSNRLVKVYAFSARQSSFSPHLTLHESGWGTPSWSALAKGGVLDRPLSLGSLAVESVVLMKSELKPTGAVYTRLWEARLKAC